MTSEQLDQNTLDLAECHPSLLLQCRLLEHDNALRFRRLIVKETRRRREVEAAYEILTPGPLPIAQGTEKPLESGNGDTASETDSSNSRETLLNVDTDESGGRHLRPPPTGPSMIRQASVQVGEALEASSHAAIRDKSGGCANGST